MSARIVKVKSCKNCPYCEFDDCDIEFCRISKIVIKDINIIDSSCTLEEYKEFDIGDSDE